ncbi:hypothetical protein EVG20_g2622 [Dentipellis fragilis]|uniref:Adenosine kinase n=1 Tax=Dentipellis fragilis TaxID=205917 RepID=A0A4Y9Z796_9AGAM|nr:hypothetical protein EVG20_g2622 [Dentipellis fragilis]
MTIQSQEAPQTYPLLCIGHPLLDIQVTNGEELLQKYGLKANDAILAQEKHRPLYEEIVRDYSVTYVAGGGAQNAARGAAYVLPPNSIVFIGCVGEDEFAELLKTTNRREGLAQAYFVKKGEQTGACAVIITGHHRSLVTSLRAARMFHKTHLATPDVAKLVEAAQFYYVEGYFITHDVESALEVAKKASEVSKVFALNLSAPYVPEFFKEQLDQILPYVDILIGNDAECKTWARTAGLPPDSDIPTIAMALAPLPKVNTSRPRTVVITQGAEATVLVSGPGAETKPRLFPVHGLSEDEIVDTNGAGDAFAGGFLGALVAGKSMEECIAVGHALGTMCVQMVGPQYKWPKVKVM